MDLAQMQDLNRRVMLLNSFLEEALPNMPIIIPKTLELPIRDLKNKILKLQLAIKFQNLKANLGII